MPERLVDRLAAYAAASAGAVGMFTLAQPAGAQIVYTPANIKISPREWAPIDLNHDGVTDFTLFNENTIDFATLRVLAPEGNQVRATYLQNSFGQLVPFAAETPAGGRIGQSQLFRNGRGGNVMVSCFTGLELRRPGYGGGVWGQGSGYLGLRFQIGGQAHYGWAAIEITGRDCFAYTEFLLGYAYNTVADQPIIAGQKSAGVAALIPKPPAPATLGLLALGAPGLSVWRGDPETLTGQYSDEAFP